MKTALFCLTLILISTTAFAQTAFRKRYYFPDYFILKTDDSEPYRKVQYKIATVEKKKELPNNAVVLSYRDTSGTKDIRATLNNDFDSIAERNFPGRLKANVKFEKDQLFVNPWTMGDDEVRDRDYFFRLKNRQQIKLHYQQWTFTALTIPLKVQFGRDNSVNYQTGINIGSLLGYSLGNTRFTYRSKLDNFQRSQELTLGGLVNVSSIKFNNELGREVNTGSIALGVGLLYTYESISVGATYGFDWAVGDSSTDWNYHDRPWLGFAIGYSLFDK